VWRGPQWSFRRKGVAWSTVAIQKGGCGVVQSSREGVARRVWWFTGGVMWSRWEESSSGWSGSQEPFRTEGVAWSPAVARSTIAIQEGGSRVAI
jgi:hypothetical protein